MTASASEIEIRDAVVARLRELVPQARIIHELNVAGTGSNRIDVAAVTSQKIIGCEIKSARDTLKRLPEQWKIFDACCHYFFVVAHDRHFVDWRERWWRDDVPSKRRLNHPDFVNRSGRSEARIWRFPRPPVTQYAWGRTWEFCQHRDMREQPKAAAMLDMLWAGELRAECARHRIAVTSKSTRPQMIADMVWAMTGREICEAVCRQLRARAFVVADDAVREAA